MFKIKLLKIKFGEKIKEEIYLFKNMLECARYLNKIENKEDITIILILDSQNKIICYDIKE